MIHIDSDTGDGPMWRFLLRAHLDEHARDLASVNFDVVWQLDLRVEGKFVLDDIGNNFGCPSGESGRIVYLDPGSQQDGKPQPLPGCRLPAIASLSSPFGLMFGEQNHALL